MLQSRTKKEEQDKEVEAKRRSKGRPGNGYQVRNRRKRTKEERRKS